MPEPAEAAARLSTAVGKLIAVTGDKSIDAMWNLGDAIVDANDGNPVISHSTAWDIRQTAIRKAGHEEFWSIKRLKEIGNTAGAWPASERLPGVSLTAHAEALASDDPKALMNSIANRQNGKVSVRNVRDALGNGGGTVGRGKAAIPRLDKASDTELFDAMNKRRKDLAKLMRKNLKQYAKEIALWSDVFNDLSAIGEAIAGTTVTEATKAEEVETPIAPVERKKAGRIKL